MHAFLSLSSLGAVFLIGTIPTEGAIESYGKLGAQAILGLALMAFGYMHYRTLKEERASRETLAASHKEGMSEMASAVRENGKQTNALLAQALDLDGEQTNV